MLVETTFGVGGLLCATLGVALAVAYALTGVAGLGPGAVAAPALFVVMGAIFLWVARDARRSRLQLLALGESSGEAAKRPERRS